MLRCQYQLRDIGPGIGGLAVIPGSHKAYAQHSLLSCARVLHLKMGFAIRNFFVPEDIALHSADQDCVVAVEAKAGDMVIFLCAPTTPFPFPSDRPFPSDGTLPD